MEDIVRFVIIKGFIDGRDEKMAGSYGMFLGVASLDEVKYLSARFSPVPIDRQLGYPALLSLLHPAEEEPGGEAEEVLLRCKVSLEHFITDSRLLQASVKNMNNKQIEQRVNHFCSETLQLRSVTFVAIEAASDEDLELFATRVDENDAQEAPANGEAASDTDGEGTADSDEEGGTSDKARGVYVALEPVLDPVLGVATGELAVGDRVICRMPEDSAYYKLFENSSPGFEGLLMGEIAEIKVNEFGTAVVGVSLAEDISGVLKLSGSVRIRIADKQDYQKRHGGFQQIWGDEKGIPLGIVLGSVGVFFLLCLVGVLLFRLA